MTLSEILDDVFLRLAQASASTDHAWRTPALATTAGGWPRVRTLILRDVDAARRRLVCHSDVRAGKIAALRETPHAAWMFYDPQARRQVTCAGRAEVLTSGSDWEAAWARTPLMSRRAYLAPGVPGSRSDLADVNLPADLRTRAPTAEEVEAGRANFAVIVGTVEQMEWLQLAPEGNLRAGFAWNARGELDATWLLP